MVSELSELLVRDRRSASRRRRTPRARMLAIQRKRWSGDKSGGREADGIGDGSVNEGSVVPRYLCRAQVACPRVPITSWSGFCAEICSSPKVLSVRNVVLTRPDCLALSTETLGQKRDQTEKRRVARRSQFEIAGGGREAGHVASCCGRWRYCV